MDTFEMMMSQIPGGFLIYEANAKEKILYANELVFQIWGCESWEEFQELTGGSFCGMVDTEDLERVEKSIQEQILESKDKMDHIQYRIRRKNGEYRFIDDYGRLVHQKNGPDLFYVFLTDITEEKQAEDMSSIYEYLKPLSTVFEIVRLVDVSTATWYTVDDTGRLINGTKKCFSVWKKEERCENCISAKALAAKTQMTKYEFIGKTPFQVTARYLEMNGKPYILEMVNPVEDAVLFGAYGKENFADSIQGYTKKLYTDALTGAYNRNYFEEEVGKLQNVGAVVMIDLDNFKQVNDTYGHSAGDEALKLLVNTIRTVIREGDMIIRYGGDEFVLLFEKITKESLEERLEQIRKKVNEVRSEEYPEMRISISVGAVLGSECDDDSMKVADRMLYEAKQKKNCVKIN
ncbi:MAG: sensor domain-containing diguanylate cyclase [Lachnospiraceae bacterium]|nr:sensor domain-containing diguanylate cyclase [Lachnospiraceae bacterium]